MTFHSPFVGKLSLLFCREDKESVKLLKLEKKIAGWTLNVMYIFIDW